MKRSCGPCTLCCTLQGVREGLGAPKPPGVPCALLKDSGGCSIYESRPAECASYSCLWLQGFGLSSDRPDKLGVLFEAQETSQVFVIARTRTRGLARKPRVRKLLLKILQHHPVGIVHPDELLEGCTEQGSVVVCTEPNELTKILKQRGLPSP